MEKELLRKVQLTQLEIAKEIKRVCDDNNISYFLTFGTLLGSIRHRGFIPWDDDMDIGMLREDYDRFCEIAPKKLSSEYVFQTWENDDRYALPFGKVRKKNTRYIESKSDMTSYNGFFVDIFPFDNAPSDLEIRKRLKKELCNIERMMLMKCRYKPWITENSKVNFKKRIGYIYYQIKSKFFSRKKLIEEYMKKVRSVQESNAIYDQSGNMHTKYFEKVWMKTTRIEKFEDNDFKVPINAEKVLHVFYNNYMELPPENQRENRHMIIEVDFGNEE